MDPNSRRPYREEDGEQIEDSRFIHHFGAVSSIATSHARNDSGLFELNFRDERYLPFEGSGAVSKLRLDLPKATNHFDFETISDCILHVNYTAREGGEALRKLAIEAIVPPIPHDQFSSVASADLPDQSGLMRLFSIRHEFLDDWHRFLHPDPEAMAHTLNLDIAPDRFPFPYQGRDIKLESMELFLNFKAGLEFTNGDNLVYTFSQEGGSTYPIPDTTDGFKTAVGPIQSLPYAKAFGDQNNEPIGQWVFSIDETAVQNLDLDFLLHEMIKA